MGFARPRALHRDGRIRTGDPLNPIQVRYRTAPRPGRNQPNGRTFRSQPPCRLLPTGGACVSGTTQSCAKSGQRRLGKAESDLSLPRMPPPANGACWHRPPARKMAHTDMITARHPADARRTGKTNPAGPPHASGREGRSIGVGSRCPAGCLRSACTPGHSWRGSTRRTRPGVDTPSRIGVSLGFLMRGGAVW